MKYMDWLSVAVWVCVASGCSNGDSDRGDPIGFTFKSAPGSFASFGWTGAFHAQAQAPETPFGVKTTACRNDVCGFEGPTDPLGNVERQRCLFRTSVECTSEDDCRLDGETPTPCVYVYDAPVSTPLKGDGDPEGACAWSYIPLAPKFKGSLHMVTGALTLEDFTLNLVLNAEKGNRFRGACAECVGDSVPNDGIREGTCMAATRNGLPVAHADPSPDIADRTRCDINRVGKANGYNGNFSMDCSPTVQAGVGPPIALGGTLSTSGAEIVLGERSPSCTTNGDKCFCGMCKGSAIACMSNDECANGECVVPVEQDCLPAKPGEKLGEIELVANQCKQDLSRVAVQNSYCSDECKWDDAQGRGSCKSTLTGNPVISCYPTALNSKISVAGSSRREEHVSTVYHAETASARCMPAANTEEAAQTTSQVGLPGLLFQKRNFQIIPEYAESK